MDNTFRNWWRIFVISMVMDVGQLSRMVERCILQVCKVGKDQRLWYPYQSIVSLYISLLWNCTTITLWSCSQAWQWHRHWGPPRTSL